MKIELKDLKVGELVNGYQDDGESGGACYSDNRSKRNIGAARPQGGGCDIGAIEYVGS